MKTEMLEQNEHEMESTYQAFRNRLMSMYHNNTPFITYTPHHAMTTKDGLVNGKYTFDEFYNNASRKKVVKMISETTNKKISQHIIQTKLFKRTGKAYMIKKMYNNWMLVEDQYGKQETFGINELYASDDIRIEVFNSKENKNGGSKN